MYGAWVPHVPQKDTAKQFLRLRQKHSLPELMASLVSRSVPNRKLFTPHFRTKSSFFTGLTELLNVGDDSVPSLHIRSSKSIHGQDDERRTHKPACAWENFFKCMNSDVVNQVQPCYPPVSLLLRFQHTQQDIQEPWSPHSHPAATRCLLRERDERLNMSFCYACMEKWEPVVGCHIFSQTVCFLVVLLLEYFHCILFFSPPVHLRTLRILNTFIYQLTSERKNRFRS